ncbi:MAG TPA: sortase [Herpetosiphonaceae bacterium]
MQSSHTLAGEPRRLAWTLGNLLMLAGCYLLVYVGGVYADEAYGRAAARGDSALPLAVAAPIDPAPAGDPLAGAAAFVAPNLNAAALPVPAAPQPHVSSVTRIEIPSIGVDSKVVEVGWDLVDDGAGGQAAVWQVAKFAVGQHRGSANPGEGGNVVMAGHVGGAGPVFARLIELKPGDQLTLNSRGQQYLYVVRESLRLQEIGAADEERLANAAYMDPTPEEMVTLITCWPATGPDAFDQRIVVRAVPFSAAAPIDSAVSNWGVR